MKEKSYMIVGIRSENGKKRLELKPVEDMVQKQEEINPMAALKNISGLVEKTKQMYSKGKNMDIIRISDDEFKELDLQIDGGFTIKY